MTFARRASAALRLALLVVMAVAAGAVAAAGLAGGKGEPGPDYAQPFTLQLAVRVPDDRADLQPLYDALERQGFRTSIRVRQLGDAATGIALVAEGVDAWRYDDFSAAEVEAIARQVKALVAPFGGDVAWSYRQHGVEASL